jgi:hypothetical protein
MGNPSMTDDELRQRMADIPPVPCPLQTNDIVIGDFLSYDVRTSAEYGDFYIAILENADVKGVKEPPDLVLGDGRVTVALFHQAARSEFRRARPQRGDRIAFQRLPRTTSKGGRSYVPYRLVPASEQARQITEADVFGDLDDTTDGFEPSF